MIKTLATLPTYTQSWIAKALSWMDTFWDDDLGLIWSPSANPDKPGHDVRSTIWYALGLFMRQEEGDVGRACQAIEAVLGNQFDAPETVFHGAFYRAPEEPYPPANPTEWRDYDPNWREFIGTVLAILLEDYAGLLPADLVTAIDAALYKAAEGAYRRNVRAGYTNIALMSAYLLDFAGQRLQVPAWRDRSATLVEAIYDLYQPNETFAEYNSPTYYGTDLYALAQWRAFGLTARMRDLGREMEAGLWRDIGRFYHAGLKNLCGPFDRSYGMDMRKYISLTGLWIACAVDEAQAPVPDIGKPFGHRHDLCFMPAIAAVGVEIPEDVRPHLTTFSGPRQVTRTIEPAPRRIATAWLAESVMVGGESTGGSRAAIHQFHPATLHWQLPDGDVGWLKLTCYAPVDAVASNSTLTNGTLTNGTLTITCYGQQVKHPDLEATFQIYAPGLSTENISGNRWQLPGLIVQVETTAGSPRVVQQADLVEIHYPVLVGEAAQPVMFTLTCTPTG